jgi:hypothetical protein
MSFMMGIILLLMHCKSHLNLFSSSRRHISLFLFFFVSIIDYFFPFLSVPLPSLGQQEIPTSGTSEVVCQNSGKQ